MGMGMGMGDEVAEQGRVHMQAIRIGPPARSTTPLSPGLVTNQERQRSR